MDTIRELFYGNIHPFERDIKQDSESDRLAKLILRHDAALKSTMNESEIELFGKFKDAVTELNCLNECEGFINGFRLGIRLMVEALNTVEKIAALNKWAATLLRFIQRNGFLSVFRRVSPCVRFVEESRVSTRLRAFARCRAFVAISECQPVSTGWQRTYPY